MIRSFGLALFLSGIFASTAAAGILRTQLSLFLEIADQDSLLSLTQIGADQLEVELKKAGEVSSRKSRQSIPPAVLEKLVANARMEGVTVGSRAAEAGVESHPPPRTGAVTASGQQKNRWSYVWREVLLSSYTFGPAVVNALDLDGSAAGATVLFGITGSVVGQSWFGFTHSFEDGHIAALTYLPISALAGSYLTSLLILGPNDGVDRLGSGLVLGAYPLSLWAGYNHGESYVDNPGRVNMELAFAWPFAAAGAFLPLIYFGKGIDDISGDGGVRLVAGQALAFGVVGHFASRYYRPGERIPQGVPGGVLAHTLIGFLGGLSVSSTLESDNVRLSTGIVFAGAVAGFAEGLYSFRASRDNRDRSFYSALGMVGGAAFAGGLLTLIESDEPSVYTWMFTAGATGGYALTYFLLRSQVETAFRIPGTPSITRHVSLDLLPLPEPRRLADSRVEMGYRIPGITVRF